MSIVGLVLLPISLGIDKINSQYNPATDFDAIDFDVSTGNGCTIIAAEHMAEQRQYKDPYCVDVYILHIPLAMWTTTMIIITQIPSQTTPPARKSIKDRVQAV